LLAPYIVKSRINPELIKRLNDDNNPVLVEGIHCTGIIPFLKPQKKIVVRVHNDEAEYYHTLYKTESNFLKKLYFLYESKLLASYQSKISEQAIYAFISTKDKKAFEEKYDQGKQVFLPCFIPWQNVLSQQGKGEYCLYHGNLSVSENFEAAVWLIKNVFSKLDLPLVIAGRDANRLYRFQNKSKIKLINNPSDAELSSLIQNAHINVLLINTTGVKLKLLHALFEGRFCISNSNGIAGSGVEDYVIQAESPGDWIAAIQKTHAMEFTSKMLEERKKIFSVYNNQINAQKLKELL
jgi:hypothetical protein